jgi:2-keto-3-deoxy-6-phosphogluconate aldolase
LFCVDAGKTAEFMRNVKVPWIAFKVMAAGAITPEDGFSYAFQNGADFICAGMFDWQVDKDVEIATKSIAAAKDRKRPWFG